jgi:general stress protein YciG
LPLKQTELLGGRSRGAVVAERSVPASKSAGMSPAAARRQVYWSQIMAQDRSEAGRKGGEATSEDREHMSEIGKKGGEHSHGGRSGQHEQSGSSHGQQGHSSGKQGGSSEQHREAGKQSHKNS